MKLKKHIDFITENIYDDKITDKNDLTFLMKQLTELIDGVDSYKATVKRIKDEIVINHEDSNKKQKIIIKDNGNPNDFFIISGVDSKGKQLDNTGEQPFETIVIIISKLFQEI